MPDQLVAYGDGEVDLLKKLLIEKGGVTASGDGVEGLWKKLVITVGSEANYGDGVPDLEKKFLIAIGGHPAYGDSEHETLKKILLELGGNPEYDNADILRKILEANTSGPGSPAPWHANFKFKAGSEYPQVGEAAGFQIFAPGGITHLFYAAVGSATVPTTGVVGTPVIHAVDNTGLEADESKAAFDQTVVNAGSPTPTWLIAGYTQQIAPVNTVAPSLDNTTPSAGTIVNANHGVYNNSPTSYSIQWTVNGVNSGVAGPGTTFDVSSLSGGDVLTFIEVASNSVGPSAPTPSSNSAIVTVLADPVLWQSQLISNNPAFFSSGPTSQKIKGPASGSVLVTRVDIDIPAVFTPGSLTVKLTQNADGSGTLFGTSNTLSVSSSGVKSFVFADPGISISADFHFYVQNAGGAYYVGTGYNGSFVESYLTGQGYDALIEGTSNVGGINPSDMYFAIYARP